MIGKRIPSRDRYQRFADLGSVPRKRLDRTCIAGDLIERARKRGDQRIATCDPQGA
jgi:hypothetical protein